MQAIVENEGVLSGPANSVEAPVYIATTSKGGKSD